MERFIGQTTERQEISNNDLKSSMEKFIGTL